MPVESQTMNGFTVAIDGPAAAGKGTIARSVAEHFGFAYLDSGLLYRAVGYRSLAGENPVAAAHALKASELHNPGLRGTEVATAASRVAASASVRAALLAFQRDFARRPGGAVLDGRDIGTVICPEAEVKLYVTADADIRALRRHRELAQQGETVCPQRVLADLLARDERDLTRVDAPLRRADDAKTIDTSNLDIAEATKRAISAVESQYRRV